MSIFDEDGDTPFIFTDCPDCANTKIGDPPEKHSFHCIAGLGPTCQSCFYCMCGAEPCKKPGTAVGGLVCNRCEVSFE